MCPECIEVTLQADLCRQGMQGSAIGQDDCQLDCLYSF